MGVLMTAFGDPVPDTVLLGIVVMIAGIVVGLLGLGLGKIAQAITGRSNFLSRLGD